nr:hypothetical protein [Streptomyces sp. WAC04770]
MTRRPPPGRGRGPSRTPPAPRSRPPRAVRAAGTGAPEGFGLSLIHI